MLAEPDDALIGSVNEDWAVESNAGDIFLLGTHSWQIRKVEPGVVRVRDAGNAPPTVPFWRGEAPARTAELSAEVSALRLHVDDCLAGGEPDGARRTLMQAAGIDADAASMIVDYLAAGRAVLGVMPSQQDLVLERFFDDTGGMQLVLHSPFGARVNRGLGLALRKKFCRTFNFELQAAATDDAIVLSLGLTHSFPLQDVPRFLSSRTVADTLEHAILDSPMFQARWRWNLNRSLMVLRFRNGRRNPPPIQRMESDDLLAAVFPQAAACQDNIVGPIEIPDHVLVRQTIDDTLHEAIDIDGVRDLLERIEARRGAHPLPRYDRAVGAGARDHHRPAVRLPGRRGDAESAHQRRPPASRASDGAGDHRRARPGRHRARARRDRAGARDGRRPARFVVLDAAAPPVRAWHHSGRSSSTAGAAEASATPAIELWTTTESPHDAHGPRWQASTRPSPRALRGHLELSGITTAEALPQQRRSARTKSPSACSRSSARDLPCRAAIARAPAAPNGSRDGCSRACTATRNARAASPSRPVTAQDFMRFLLRWQHVAPKRSWPAKPAWWRFSSSCKASRPAAAAWEPELFARRLSHYEPAWLDALCHAGEVAWLRLTPRSSDEVATPSKSTPMSVVLRSDLRWLLAAVRGDRCACRRRSTAQRARCSTSCASAAPCSPPISRRRRDASPTRWSARCGMAWRAA